MHQLYDRAHRCRENEAKLRHAENYLAARTVGIARSGEVKDETQHPKGFARLNGEFSDLSRLHPNLFDAKIYRYASELTAD